MEAARNVNITVLNEIVAQAIKDKQPVRISTEAGNAVVMSQEEYDGLMETVYLTSIPGVKEQIIEAHNAPDSEYLSEDEWLDE